MIGSRIWKRGAAALAMMACGLATAQPVGYDFNDDGYSDYPVSIISYDDTNPDVGAARIWSGASKTILHTIVGTDTNTLFGWSAGSAGDLDADGKDDLIVGEPLWSAASNHEGRIRVFSGDDASVLLTITGPYVDTGLGRYVTGIGDWNGDGTPDIAASGWDIADTDSDGIGDDPIGIVYIFSGADGALLTEIIEPTATSSFGYSVFGLGDITGNGKADIAITDPHAELIPGAGMPGQLYIFEGSSTATAYDLTDAHRTISNTDPASRVFAAQVDVMHPDLWLDEPTLQIINLTEPGSGGVNEAPIAIDIRKADGTLSGTKGTRLSLQLAGDINLDGVVDAADLQDSISQLGTDPQAIGVMPIADSNEDGIIDLLDVQVVVDGYGQTTDIYEGLWDGSRLLSVAAGASGFGSTANISGNPFGGTQFGGGPRPTDNCNRSTTPPDQSGTLVPSLLRDDARNSCAECPECDEPDPNGCYECSEEGNVTGGEISVSPSQPKPGEEITFTISPWQINGRKEKCKESCGPEGTECDIDVADRQPEWVLETSDGNGGWWVFYSGSTPTVSFTASSCAQYRLRLPEDVLFGAADDCNELKTTEDEKEVQVAEFTLDYTNIEESAIGDKRTTVGVCEVTTIEVVEGVSVTWEILSGGGSISETAGISTDFTATYEADTVTVRANIDEACYRDLTFTIVEPDGIRMLKVGEWHLQNMSSSGFCAFAQFLPISVSFKGVHVREGETVAVASGSFAGWAGTVHPEGNGFPIGDYNFDSAIDTIRTSAYHPNPNPAGYTAGSFLWAIPWEFKCGNGDWKEFAVVEHTATIDSAGTITTSKGGQSSTHKVTDIGELCP